MLLAIRLNAIKPVNTFSNLDQSKISPAKKTGIYKNRFFAQSFGRSNFKYITDNYYVLY